MTDQPTRAAQVLLYSGGMDSFLASFKFPEAKLLFIDTRSTYSKKERIYLNHPSAREFIIDDRLDLGAWERDDLIVPARNLLLVTMASHYGCKIILAATAGDKSYDKDRFFAQHSSALLEHLYNDPHLIDSLSVEDSYEPTRVLLPFLNKAKGEMVADYIKNGGDPVALSNTVSCYHPSLKHCGLCKACVRKWVALQFNHCDHTPWETNPVKWDGWAGAVNKINSLTGWRCPVEDEQTLAVLQANVKLT